MYQIPSALDQKSLRFPTFIADPVAASGDQMHVLLVLVAVMIGIITAMATGILARADGASYPSAIIRAGVAFAGAVTLAVLVINALHLS